MARRISYSGDDGKLHVNVARAAVGGGLNISQEDWDAIWEPKPTSKESLPEDSLQEDPLESEEH